jgi:hypothetical protein
MSMGYRRVSTVERGGDEAEQRNPLNSRDVELARFNRMAESSNAYPSPPRQNNNRNNNSNNRR